LKSIEALSARLDAVVEAASRVRLRADAQEALEEAARLVGATEAEEVDRSTDETVVEYAIHEVFKNKTPKQAAAATAKKLSGGWNMMLGPGITIVDPKKLESAIWDRFLEKTKVGTTRGWDDATAADSALQVFYTKYDDKTAAFRAKLIPELVKRMQAKR
jgi:hypothetical protein